MSEQTIASEKTNVMAWGSHIDGAVQLVKMRGKKQLRTKVGHQLFQTVRTQMVSPMPQESKLLFMHYQIINCMSASKAPPAGTEWWLADVIRDENGVFVTKLNMRVAELRAEVNQVLAGTPRVPENFQQVLELIHRAQAMEQEFLCWEDSLPDFWAMKTVAWVDNIPNEDLMNADVCPGKVDMYNDLFVANAWNYARVSRLFLHGIIVRCAAWVCHPIDYRTHT